MHQIVIQGETVMLQSIQEEKVVSIKSFKDQFRRLVGVRTPILPKGCLFYLMKGNVQALLIEREPGTHVIRHKEAQYEITFPYHYFFLMFTGYAFEDMLFFFRNEPLGDVKDEMFIPPLTNLGADCRVCLGNELRFSVQGTLQNKITRVISYFYESRFNEDLSGNYLDHMPEEIKQETTQSASYFTVWERLMRDGVDVCSFHWHKYKPFEAIVDEAIVEGE